MSRIGKMPIPVPGGQPLLPPGGAEPSGGAGRDGALIAPPTGIEDLEGRTPPGLGGGTRLEPPNDLQQLPLPGGANAGSPSTGPAGLNAQWLPMPKGGDRKSVV